VPRYKRTPVTKLVIRNKRNLLKELRKRFEHLKRNCAPRSLTARPTYGLTRSSDYSPSTTARELAHRELAHRELASCSLVVA
jgi:hypothetical protein